MVTAHDMRHRVETNINDIFRGYSPTNEAYDVAHGNIYRNFLRDADTIATQYIHMYGEHELPDAAIDDLANEVDSALVEIVSYPHDYAALTSNPVDAERHLANNRDEVIEAYEALGGTLGGSDAASDPVSAVDAWNKVCAEKVAQHWESKVNWLYDSLTDL